MNFSENNDFFYQDISILKGIGKKTKELLKKKKIEKVSDLLWNLPYSFTDRSKITNLNSLEIGKISTIKVKVIKYNIPRIRNLPNQVQCEDNYGKVNIVFFNSYEGYIRKVLPLNSWVIVSGKVNFYKNKYQITNPQYIVPSNKENYVKQIIPKYSLTEGITEKIYRKIIEQVIVKIPSLGEWHSENIIKKFKNVRWKDALTQIHKYKNSNYLNSIFYRRLAYDEILANLLVLSQIRKRIKKLKKTKKIFSNKFSKIVENNFKFFLTKNQKKIIDEINFDLKSENKMFRLLQGDVGSGKTIIALMSAINVIEANYQVAIMTPTDILGKQHFELAKNIFKNTDTNIDFLSGKTSMLEKKRIKREILEGKINLLVGTHALFQKNIAFKKLGLIIIDEQHKFGVKQRMELSLKGGDNCDVLLMSATPIPRTLILTCYGDMDISKLIEKPTGRKEVLTFSKPESKIDDIIQFIKKKIDINDQVFWVCPLIEESKKLDFVAAVKRYEFLRKYFNNKVGLIHGSMKKNEKETVLQNFLNQKLNILVSTTIIEVGIDFPNANIIVIENANKFGLSQLHQLRGRVGRGKKQSNCILMYKKSLSEKAKKRIKILKSTNDGFKIAEEDMRLRGFGDILGYQQSGVKDFKLADPIHHKELFILAEKNIKEIEKSEKEFLRYKTLLKLFDKSEIINQIDS